MSTKFDIYEEVTNRIIKQLEQGVIPWHKPWKSVCTPFIKAPVDLRKVAFNRITNDHFGSAGYSKEELVAEISAAGMLNLLNIETPETFTNSAAYVQSWIKALKNDTKMIVIASGKAEKAIQYIINGKEETTEEGAA